MLALASWLREWAGQKVASDTRFAHTAFVISDAAEPGRHKQHLSGTTWYREKIAVCILHHGAVVQVPATSAVMVCGTYLRIYYVWWNSNA